jgi:Myotubularin-like phosphatase domain
MQAVSWFVGQVCLARASQPKAGIFSKRSHADETLVSRMRASRREYITYHGGGLDIPASSTSTCSTLTTNAPSTTTTTSVSVPPKHFLHDIGDEQLLISDARPRMNAIGNAAKGLGSELVIRMYSLNLFFFSI